MLACGFMKCQAAAFLNCLISITSAKYAINLLLFVAVHTHTLRTHTHTHLHVCLCVGLLSTVWDSSALPQLFQIAPLDSFFYDCFMYCAIKTKIMANRKYKHTHTHTYSHIYTHTFTFSYTHCGKNTRNLRCVWGIVSRRQLQHWRFGFVLCV